MARRNLLRVLSELGWFFSRNGGDHEIWFHKNATRFIPIPRGRTIDAGLSKHIVIQARRYLFSEVAA